MTNPKNPTLATRIVAGFLLAALATYIPIAVFAVVFMDVEYLWGGGTYPPPPGNEYAGSVRPSCYSSLAQCVRWLPESLVRSWVDTEFI